jgi:hypothetical protein
MGKHAKPGGCLGILAAAGAVIAGLIAAVAVAGPALANGGPSTSGTWTAVNANYGQVATRYNNTADALQDISPITGHTNWQLINYSSGYGELEQANNTGNCLTWNQSRHVIDRIACANLVAQQWAFSSGHWISRYNAQCVEAVPSGSNLLMAPCTSGSRFSWDWQKTS